ncbi:DMT family transporter [Sphingomonas desiccabilis]|uniref:DMT family transporter n=1 Tax=Sphingomonas desiccabilis TaxID=429134 RepID=A0A4Q2IQ18_9SPHN|nr:DMT family transporter [Sphingomonas desiccabilis]MBB3912093.1 drug/metabolite transporter (DMT)-like permease [Sphingomonas desiccabilis]RXZ30262.1 DMT family transporter [Sphingomonas desiccabilis]
MFYRHASALLPTTAFVLLWSSGAIVSEIGLQHGSPFALLILRYAIAFMVLSAFAVWNGTLLPERGTRRRNTLIGFLIAGLYSAFYLLALDNGITPGALATLLGVQPILTIFLTERRDTASRLLGLTCALAGLALVVSDGLASMRFDLLGLAFAGLSLAGITAGSILQKREKQAPWVVLPMQYAVGLAFAVAVSPLGEFRASWDAGFMLPVLWLGLVISVGTTFLLYRLIARGNLVNVTSLFYLVPGVTAAMDWAFLGNPMSALMMGGLALVVVGLLIVFRYKAG